VPSTILDDDIALLETNGFSFIQFEPYLTFENDSVIHGICLVHGSVFFFEVVRKPPQPAQSLLMRGVAVKTRIFENGTGRKGNNMKACPSRPRNDGLRVAIHLLLLTQIGNG
jgi:hypothetical protein